MGGKRRQGVKFVCKYLVFVLMLLFAGSVSADYGAKTKISTPVEEKGVVKLVATLQDSPAFTGVEWKLYRLEQPAHPVRVIRRHTAMVNLKPGNYRAVVKLRSIKRSRDFNIKSRIVKEIIVPMD